MYRLRNHPSVLVWLNGSDETPAPAVEKSYLEIERDLSWPNPVLGSAAETVSEVSGPSGVKMAGPYEWVPPIYWETDRKRLGGAWGFATEICPGPSIPTLESLSKFIPPDELWPISKSWLYHCGQNEFATLDIFTDALNRRYGASDSAEEYSAKAQLAAYEAHRAMFEAAIWTPQIRGERRDPMDDDQRLAFDDMAFARLLSPARRFIFYGEECA